MHGERFYGGLVLGVFLVETLAIGDLAYHIIFGHAGSGAVVRALLAALAVSITALAVLTAHTLGAEANTARRARARRAALPRWRERWLDVIDGAAPPAGPLPDVAIEALVEIRELLSGEEQARVEAVCLQLGVAETLIAALGSRRRIERIAALEALARARLREAFEPLLWVLSAPDFSLRPMTARALARTFSALARGAERERGARALASWLAASALPRGVVEETLLLLEDGADEVIAQLLRPGRPKAALRGAAGALGALRLVHLVDSLGPLLADADREVRAVGLRALADLGVGTPELAPAVIAAVTDPDEEVRAAACAAAGLLPAETSAAPLWLRLGDRAWSVRLAAAEALFASDDGRARLHEAAGTHPDRFAREMAAQVLHDGEARPALVEAA